MNGMVKDAYEVVVIGSGFGGSIMALRLTEAQRRQGLVSLCVLERGKRYRRGEFPRNLGRTRDWWWRDEGRHGWKGLLQFRRFSNISVLHGSGVGGTSLIYLDVQINAFPSTFALEQQGRRRWPTAIRGLQDLAPYYCKVEEMLHPSPIPNAPAKTYALKQAAESAVYGDRFRLVDLAVYWGQGVEERGVLRVDPYASAERFGIPGPPQSGCAHCGECFIGCNTHSKNTVDLNYLWFAEQLGAEVHSQHKVVGIEPSSNGASAPDFYRIRYEDLRWGLIGEVRARRVILAAGTLGSTELLWRCKAGYRQGRRRFGPTLPRISDQLGKGFSGNGDYGAVAFETNRIVNPMVGPTITATVDLQSELGGKGFLIEDGGFPDLLRAGLRELPGGLAAGRGILSFLRRLSKKVHYKAFISGIFEQLDFETVRDALPYLVMGLDAADGEMSIDREGQLQIAWQHTRSLPFFRRIEDVLRRISEEPSRGLDGSLMANPTWSAQRELITVHPLGGCPMGDDATRGVVDADGEVFGYPNLYVVDGSIVPTAIGPNPSKTIAALAERIAARMIARDAQVATVANGR